MRIEKFEPQIGAAKSKHDRGVTRSRPMFKRGGINVGFDIPLLILTKTYSLREGLDF